MKKKKAYFVSGPVVGFNACMRNAVFFIII